jgi:hypothetical protein
MGWLAWVFLLRAGCESMDRLMGDGGVLNSLLIITGSMGAGKSSVMDEASDILAQRKIVHAAIDLDALGVGYLPSGARNDGAMYKNLRSICGNYAALGVQRFLVARAIEGEAQLKLCREIIPAVDTVVCRVTASLETMRRRVEMRDVGMAQGEYVARVGELNSVLDRARLEDFAVVNEDRLLTDVAMEMLRKAGWISN